MTDPVPAIAEADARGETARIFADIRAVYGVGVVNLIWRHLAVFEGALPWAWGSLRPLYIDGGVAHGAAALRAARRRLPLPALPVEVLRAAGISAQDQAGITAILDAYERTNPMALVALTLLREALRPGFAPAAAQPVPPPPPPESSIALPALLPLAAMPPDVAALVLRLNGLGAATPAPILASMYRHLAHWPAYLALCWCGLTAIERELPDAIAEVRAEAARQVLGLSGRMPHLPPPTDPNRVVAALDAFLEDAISRMVVIAGSLRRAMPG